MDRTYLLLAAAIVAEVVATTALKSSDGFTRPIASTIAVAGFLLAFYLLALTLRSLPTGVVYAIWSGVGIVLITLVAWLLHGQRLDLPALAGMALIVAGVAVIQLGSRVTVH